jgi:hypothetical protein
MTLRRSIRAMTGSLQLQSNGCTEQMNPGSESARPEANEIADTSPKRVQAQISMIPLGVYFVQPGPRDPDSPPDRY